MSFILFEDAGKIGVGKQLSAGDASSQVELESGKRVKLKNNQIFLRFNPPSETVAAWLEQAQTLADDMDVDLAWEFAPETEFDFIQLAVDYFGSASKPQEQVAALLFLRGVPYYFRRSGKGGRFKKVDAETVQQALRGIEKKKQIEQQIDTWAQALTQGECPEPIREQIYKILFKPDKNASEYKAVAQAAYTEKISVLALLEKVGAIDSPYALHWQRFLWELFPKGLQFAPLSDWQAKLGSDLPLASTSAVFSIDDSSTTEIDDAFSVQGLGSGQVRVGIHIACPALGISPDDAVDVMARERLSTVYMPGAKITMLPKAVIDAYTLRAGQECVALSLYTVWDETNLSQISHETVLDRVFVSDNLRLNALEPLVEVDAQGDLQAAPELPYLAELQFLYRLARRLKSERESVRGKPDVQNRADFIFEVHKSEGETFPIGNEPIDIQARQRGAPLDLIVAENMILANHVWGAWLGELGVLAIYRSQARLAPGVKVRMGTKPLPHAGIGVSCYAWSTSPLRRYVDLINQWQLLAALQHGNAAGLVAPFNAKNNSSLFAVVSAFDAAHASYNSFQNRMERYWTLQHLIQNNTQELDASVLREGLVRLQTLPLVVSVPQTQQLERGSMVRVAIQKVDLVALEVSASLIEVLEQTANLDPSEEADSIENTAFGFDLPALEDLNSADAASAQSVMHPEHSSN